MDHYGGKCACCGESEIVFLTLDHPNLDGNKHRRKLGLSPGLQFYCYLIKHSFIIDVELRVLCYNCNMATKYGKPCPHTLKIG